MNALVEVEDGVEQLLSREVVARRLDCDPSTVRRMVKEGRFPPPLMIGNMPRWREADVNAWIKARSATAAKIAETAAKSLDPVKRRG